MEMVSVGDWRFLYSAAQLRRLELRDRKERGDDEQCDCESRPC